MHPHNVNFLTGCNEDLFRAGWKHRNSAPGVSSVLHCFNQVNNPGYSTVTDDRPCSTDCKTLVGVESAARCHDLVKADQNCAAAGAAYFMYRANNQKCWAQLQ